jgi:hypothetical protein
MGATTPLAATKGKETRLTCALLGEGQRVEPTEAVLTIAGTEQAKGATAVTLSAAPAAGVKMFTGQYLQAKDTNGLVYVMKLDADFEGGTSLDVAPLPEAIPASATIQWPVRFNLRTQADIDFSYENEEVNTYDHEDNGDAVPTSSSASISLAGLYSAYDAGGLTTDYAAQNRLEVWISRTLGRPTPAYKRGAVIAGAAIIEGIASPAPNDSFVASDYTARFVGDITRKDPDPID